MRLPDESKIHQSTFGMRARARVCPFLLFGACAAWVDAKPYARAGRKIEREARTATEESISNQRSHTCA